MAFDISFMLCEIKAYVSSFLIGKQLLMDITNLVLTKDAAFKISVVYFRDKDASVQFFGLVDALFCTYPFWWWMWQATFILDACSWQAAFLSAFR